VTPGSPPRVLVDATSVPADRGGVGRYVDGLLGAVAKVIGSGLELAVVALRTDAERYGRMLPAAEVIAAPAAVAHRPARLAWEQTGLPLLAQQVGAEVLHSPFYTCPLRSGCPVTVTVHDATFFTEPEHYDKSRRTFFRSAIKTALRRAERVIVPSKATRDELIRLLDADPTRIDVAYHGVDHAAFHPPTDEEKARIRARLGLGGALVAAYPSYGEGFGLPILEAMACAAPVLTTPRLSLPEVGGDAVAYTSEDPEQIAADLGALLDDEARRLALAKAGFDRAKEFTWESSAEVHVAAWSRAAA
jgi:glycosyltransferase involved in cell wall biosynthesis